MTPFDYMIDFLLSENKKTDDETIEYVETVLLKNYEIN